ncbi:MAG: hypothetical protein IPH84_00675 [Bacteroidales bacterium]|nr:hypothetical protein [Bacteroidales bacterium]
MKRGIALFIGLIWALSIKAQVNYCEIFINSFNESAQGFPSFRPGIPDSLVRNTDINPTFVEPYGLKSGWIGKAEAQQSARYPGHTYTEWEMHLRSNATSAGESSLEEVYEPLKAQFSQSVNSIYQSCLQELALSESYNITEEYSNLVFGYLIYPKAVTLSEKSDFSKAKEELREFPYIYITLEKSWGVNSYYFSYSIHGLRYNE